MVGEPRGKSVRPPTYVFTNRVYPPVAGATGLLLRQLAEGLAADGARVVVLTSQGPRDLGLPKRETIAGVELVRVGSAPFTRASHARRALSYAGLYPQFAWQLRRLGAVDAVVSMTDPPLQIAAISPASPRGTSRIHWAQDLYPELAENLGVLRPSGWMAQALRALSRRALKQQDAVVAVGRCMESRLLRRGVDPRRLRVIANWSPVSAAPVEQVAALRQSLGWNKNFVVLYSGNLGLAHDFGSLIEAARLLEPSGARIVFAGEGPRLEELCRTVKALPHVSVIPPRPAEELAAFLGAADLHLVSIRPDLAGLLVPSKIYGILAAGRPVLHVGPDEAEAARLLSESGAGLSFQSGDATGLARTVRELISDHARRARLGENARRAAEDFTFTKALARWRDVLHHK